MYDHSKQPDIPTIIELTNNDYKIWEWNKSSQYSLHINKDPYVNYIDKRKSWWCRGLEKVKIFFKLLIFKK